ncbi:DUF6194 family protein [Chitinophaga arvensicola]|uniref:DUF6194 domain-containing protein n=1 Tax=Chitinophaga arvensicola TaxID=29529 RepID=A0A1I0SAC1_9BACT|nr:DUF6194 family protein [Chitinophaga arvensicola]SEW53439.1 hypothetical protein SAMN04488122_5464 [Chitinophaga arvensicola]
MNSATIQRYITENLQDSRLIEAEGDTFFFYGADNNFPFATIVTKDNDFDHLSNLNRADVYRLNIGVGAETFRKLFDRKISREDAEHPELLGYDFTALDQLMPHPLYGRMYWISVLNPGEATFQQLSPLLEEAYQLSVKRDAKQQG